MLIILHSLLYISTFLLVDEILRKHDATTAARLITPKQCIITYLLSGSRQVRGNEQIAAANGRKIAAVESSPRPQRQVSAVADGPRDALHHVHRAVHRSGRSV